MNNRRDELMRRWLTPVGVRQREAILRELVAAQKHQNETKVDLCRVQDGFGGEQSVPLGADLRGIDLSGLNLDHTQLLMNTLDYAVFDRSSLRCAWLHNAGLSGASFRSVIAPEAMLTEVNATGACFDNAVLTHANLLGGKLTTASFRGANLDFVDFALADLTGANLEGATTDGANFGGAIVHRAILPEEVWMQVAAEFNWLAPGLASRVDVTGVPEAHCALMRRAWTAAGLVGIRLVAEGSAVFMEGTAIMTR
jgi:uncharacterized protein YjbI with pentapeptide repeats